MEKTKAQKALKIATELAKVANSSVDFHNAFFGVGGKFGELFPTLAERRAFSKSDEYQRIRSLRAKLARIESVFLELSWSLNSAHHPKPFDRSGPRGYLFLPADTVVDEFLAKRDPAESDMRQKLIDQLLKSHHVENDKVRVPKRSSLGNAITSSRQ
jgi:hypothetical protein